MTLNCSFSSPILSSAVIIMFFLKDSFETVKELSDASVVPLTKNYHGALGSQFWRNSMSWLFSLGISMSSFFSLGIVCRGFLVLESRCRRFSVLELDVVAFFLSKIALGSRCLDLIVSFSWCRVVFVPESRCCRFLVLESRCCGFLVLGSRCRGIFVSTASFSFSLWKQKKSSKIFQILLKNISIIQIYATAISIMYA